MRKLLSLFGKPNRNNATEVAGQLAFRLEANLQSPLFQEAGSEQAECTAGLIPACHPAGGCTNFSQVQTCEDLE